MKKIKLKSEKKDFLLFYGDRLVSTTKITGKGQIKIANLLLEGINHAV